MGMISSIFPHSVRDKTLLNHSAIDHGDGDRGWQRLHDMDGDGMWRWEGGCHLTHCILSSLPEANDLSLCRATKQTFLVWIGSMSNCLLLINASLFTTYSALSLSSDTYRIASSLSTDGASATALSAQRWTVIQRSCVRSSISVSCAFFGVLS